MTEADEAYAEGYADGKAEVSSLRAENGRLRYLLREGLLAARPDDWRDRVAMALRDTDKQTVVG